MEIRRLSPGDEQEVIEASALFDNTPDPTVTATFLAREGHHLLIAYKDGQPAGFVSGIEIVHPDKGIEMLLYELGVDDGFQRRGIGAALVSALRDLAVQRGCSAMWVLTDHDNMAALATYRRGGAEGQSEHVLLEWRLDREASRG